MKTLAALPYYSDAFTSYVSRLPAVLLSSPKSGDFPAVWLFHSTVLCPTQLWSIWPFLESLGDAADALGLEGTRQPWWVQLSCSQAERSLFTSGHCTWSCCRVMLGATERQTE